MSVATGIIGLPGSGRTTVFNALTGGKADTASFTRDGAAPHVGITSVPEPRLAALVDVFKPKKVVPATATYIDVGASVKGLVSDKGLGGQLLAQLTSVDALINVVRAFRDESIPHVDGSLDIERDITNMDLELAFSDLALLERRLQRISVSLKAAKPTERQGLLREQVLLTRVKADLEKEIPIREMALTAEESRALANFQFLTTKPLLIVVNIGEDQLTQASSLEDDLKAHYSRANRRLITICGKVEMELAQLAESEAAELRADFGITESGTERILRLSYAMLGLISFFTTASDELKVWSVPGGTEAVKAAGKIHTDMERGFIRAEVISHRDLVRCQGLTEARQRGLLRLEGRSYTVEDGDVITFLFNV